MNRHRSARYWSPHANRYADITRGGITLIEVMVCIVLVGTILLVSLTASANLLRNQNQRRDSVPGIELAHQVLDEVTSMPFRDRDAPVFGIEADEDASDRTTFDDVDDYDNYTASPPSYRDGTFVEGYDSWSVTVTVTPAGAIDSGLATTGAVEDSLMRLVRVRCTSPDGLISQADAFVSDVPYDNDPTTSLERWRQVRLAFPDREVNIVAPMRNLPTPTY